ncbi:MAG: hypothetical protein LBE08_00770 [Bifidobacteriaceae bacterium]|jgi:hypothetical protein|nr:hypothetical protein [Bifidobacteriaceae bacterium]
MTPPSELAGHNPDSAHNEPAHDIAATIACEVATEWGLILAGPMTRVKTWAWIEHHAHQVVCAALGDLPDLDWVDVAKATNTAEPERSWTPEPPSDTRSHLDAQPVPPTAVAAAESARSIGQPRTPRVRGRP